MLLNELGEVAALPKQVEARAVAVAFLFIFYPRKAGALHDDMVGFD